MKIFALDLPPRLLNGSGVSGLTGAIHLTDQTQAIAVFAIAAYALMFLAALLLPETRGKVLEA